MKTKTCDVCGDEFVGHHRAKRCSDECKKAAAKKYLENNREAARERAREYYKANRETVLEYHRERRKGNREWRAEYQRKWREKNREALLERSREYYQENREAIIERQSAYDKTDAGRAAKKRTKAKRRGADCNGSIKHFKLADKCCRCGSTDDLELEHITPISAGGTNFIENLTTMCADCNRGIGGKHTLGPHRWAEFVRWFLDRHVAD